MLKETCLALYTGKEIDSGFQARQFASRVYGWKNDDLLSLRLDGSTIR